MNQGRKIEVSILGIMPYMDCLELQKQIHQRVIAAPQHSHLILVEHPSVITLGKHASEEDILVSQDDLLHSNTTLAQVDRGGEATAHEPGQFVAYPILNLRSFKLGPKAFVNQLEEVVRRLLANYGICAHQDETRPGVWVGDTKVCSIGIRVSRGVSYHGLALNVSNSLETFSKIVPCGIRDREMTTMERLLGKKIQIAELRNQFLQHFTDVFSVGDLTFSRKNG